VVKQIRRAAGGVALLVAVFTVLAALSAVAAAGPSQSGPSQTDVQAIYLYNFAKFVRWPAGRPGPALNICIAGQQVYAETLDKVVAGEQIGGRALAVRTLGRTEEAAGCDILFIDVSARDRVDGLVAATASKPVLTVSDVPGFLDRGGMIEFVLKDSRVRFSVDLRPVARSGISLSSELLKVAVTVNGGGAP
jgi:uncharacterized protein DUF4154